MRRTPAVAGQFYAAGREKLLREVENCFISPLGPGEVPQVASPGERRILGAVVPHAGLVYSGPVAAHVYSAIARDGFPDTFVVLGPNHTGAGTGVAVTTETFATPLGDVPVDEEIANRIIGGAIDRDSESHLEEHSIEIQLPFIKFFGRDAKFVPVCMMIQDYEMAQKVGKAVGDAIRGRNAVVLASTDFSHYVRRDAARKYDQMAIKCILDRDPKALYETVTGNHISMCGYGPVMAMLFAVGQEPGAQAQLLKYATSGDVHPMPEVVGYAGIVVKK